MAETTDTQKPSQSKKFVAFFIAEMTWKALLLVAMWRGIIEGKIDFDLALLVSLIVIVVGFVEVAYLNGQAALDRYTKVVQVAVEAGKDVDFKDISVKGGPK